MGLRVRVATAAAVATAGIADPASAALSATGGEPADPTRSLIAEVTRGTTVALHDDPRRPADRARSAHETVFGSPTRLAVLGGRGEWLQVSTETVGDRRRAWIRASAGAPAGHGLPARRITSPARRLELRRRHPGRVPDPRRGRLLGAPHAHRPLRHHRQAPGPPLRQRLRLLHPRDLRDPDRSCRRAGRAATGSRSTARTCRRPSAAPSRPAASASASGRCARLMRSVPLGTPVIIRD